MNLPAAALEYARRGWPVFPCVPRGKDPISDHGFKDATTDLDQVAAWWRETPEANIGFPPGRAGLIVLDWDSPEGRKEAQRLGLYAEPTLAVETARGEHLYFHHPGGNIGNRKINKLIDVRADRGYVLLPPSIHPTGVIYRALGKMDCIGDLPPEVVKILNAPEKHPRPERNEAPVDAGTPARRAYVRAAVEAECLELANTPEGDRNRRLNVAAFSLARFVATEEADPGKLWDLLTLAASHAGLGDKEIEKTLKSAFGARGVAV
jgi:hypothetical protein